MVLAALTLLSSRDVRCVAHDSAFRSDVTVSGEKSIAVFQFKVVFWIGGDVELFAEISVVRIRSKFLRNDQCPFDLDKRTA